MAEPPVVVEMDRRGIATATLNRPARGNAYDEEMLGALISGMEQLAADPRLRALVIWGAGKHFQAGADIDWLSQAATYPPEEAFAASMATTQAMQMLNEFPRPTIAVIQGACFGGGCGIACCVDVALATPRALFGLTEVRVGVAPTPISTHMVNAMGLRHTRRYAVTGERFGAAEALRIGLVHEVVAEEAMEARVTEVLGEIMLSAPGAVMVTKNSFLTANGMTQSPRDMALLAHESWTQRASAEGAEGLAAFKEKRPPRWAK